MAKIAVYRFSYRDKGTGEHLENCRFATLKAIKLQDGRNIEESRRIVDDSDIVASKVLAEIRRRVGDAAHVQPDAGP